MNAAAGVLVRRIRRTVFSVSLGVIPEPGSMAGTSRALTSPLRSCLRCAGPGARIGRLGQVIAVPRAV